MRCKHKQKKLIRRDVSINIRWQAKEYQTLRFFDAYAYVYVEAVTIEERLGSQLCLCRKS